MESPCLYSTIISLEHSSPEEETFSKFEQRTMKQWPGGDRSTLHTKPRYDTKNNLTCHTLDFECLVWDRYRCYGGSWFNHVLEWWEAARADPDHVLFLRYEDMLKTPEEHIRKIADFVGIPHTPDVIAKASRERRATQRSLVKRIMRVLGA